MSLILESYDPGISETGVLPDKVIQVDVVDSENKILISTIDAYVDDGTGEIQIYYGQTDTFIAPYNGSSSLSYIAGGSVDGYDAYHFIIDRTTDYDSLTNYTFRITAYNEYGSFINSSWSFTTALWFDFSVTDWMPPWVESASPDSYGVGGYTSISFEIYDDISGVRLSSVDAYLNGSPIYSNGFIAPYNGVGSSVVAKNKDGYDGYLFTFINNGTMLNPVTDYIVSVHSSDNTGHLDDYSWHFKTGVDIRNVEIGEFETNVVVSFGEDMPEDTTLTASPANYLFSNGMYARLAEVIDKKTIRLWVELFNQNPTFDLSVKNIIDSYGYELPSSYNSFSFSPFVSDANISSYNDKIRTGHYSNVVFADSERVYVGGAKGIDVFRKESSTNISRWGQVFDSYGIKAMFVMNYPNEIAISDTTAPQITNQSPEPNSRTESVSQIELTIFDADTTVEPTSVSIYVSNLLAFRGEYGGWYNDFSGQLEIGHKELNLIIVPPSPFVSGDVVVVRVLARDLLDNLLDNTYQFVIGVSSVITGWGGGSFGTSSWGGI